MMGLILAAAEITGLGAYAWARRGDDGLMMAGAGLLSSATGDPWMIMPAVTVALAGERLRDALRFERQRDRDEQEAEAFLRRLTQMLPTRSSLGAAIQELMPMVEASGGRREAETVLEQLAERWQIGAMRLVARAARLIKRSGGSLDQVIGHAVRAMARDRRRRFQRRIEESARYTTIVVLAGAPFGVVALFRLALPAFYRELTDTPIGHATTMAVGLTTAGVLAVVTRHVRRGAAAR